MYKASVRGRLRSEKLLLELNCAPKQVHMQITDSKVLSCRSVDSTHLRMAKYWTTSENFHFIALPKSCDHLFEFQHWAGKSGNWKALERRTVWRATS